MPELKDKLDSASLCRVYDLGIVPYQEAWDLQRRLAAQIGSGDHSPALLLLEHPHTYTFGRRGEAHHLLWSREDLQRYGVAVHWVDRGGDVTYHGPGQLVGYPLLPLGTPDSEGRIPGPDYLGYLRRLENLLIAVLRDFGVEAQPIEGLTGVWVELPKSSSVPAARLAKIAAIGVKVDVRGVSTHGFALNVAPDMTYWQGIVPCGIDDRPVTSLEELLGGGIELAQVRARVIERFAEIFRYRMQPQSSPVVLTDTA